MFVFPTHRAHRFPVLLRELLNGLFVLVLSTLLSAAIGAFEVKFNLQSLGVDCGGCRDCGRRLCRVQILAFCRGTRDRMAEAGGNAGGRDVDRLGAAGPAHVARRWEGLPDFRGILIKTKSGRVTFECWKTGN